MKNLFFFCIFAFCLFTTTLFSSPVFELYSKHGVDYAHDCHRSDWLGFYRPFEDKIHLRPIDKYRQPYLLNHTALHELGHWSRHRTRLGPIQGTSFMEEIMCDFVAAIIADEMNIEREKDQAIEKYIDFQIGTYLVQQKDWQNLFSEVHKTVEYLLQKPYPREKIKPYFLQFEAAPKEQIGKLK